MIEETGVHGSIGCHNQIVCASRQGGRQTEREYEGGSTMSCVSAQ